VTIGDDDISEMLRDWSGDDSSSRPFRPLPATTPPVSFEPEQPFTAALRIGTLIK